MEKNSSSIDAGAAVFSRLQTENEALKKRMPDCGKSWSE